MCKSHGCLEYLPNLWIYFPSLLDFTEKGRDGEIVQGMNFFALSGKMVEKETG